MDFWQTLWATMWGALAGAVVAAFAAWLFSLDLRRREREDRKQEREQAKIDRVSEREQDRLSREAEREQDRQARATERQEERDHQYAQAMRRQWLELDDLITRFSWADPREKVGLYPALSSTFTLTGAMAQGDDRTVFDTIADLFSLGELEGDVAISVSTILAVYARDGMPTKFAVDQLREAAKERDEAKARAEAAPSDEATKPA